MARTSLVLCFSVLIASGFLPYAALATIGASMTVEWKFQMKGTTAVKEVQAYTSIEVQKLLGDLETNCPKTKEFMAMFRIMKEYVTRLFTVSPLIRNVDPILKLKSKELGEALLSLVVKASVSSQVRINLQNVHLEAMKELDVLHTTIGSISSKHRFSGDTLTPKDLQELKEEMLRLKISLSHLIEVAVEATQGHSLIAGGVGGENNNSNSEVSAESQMGKNATAEANQGNSFEVNGSGSNEVSAETSTGQDMEKNTKVKDIGVYASSTVVKVLGSFETTCPKTKEFLALFNILKEYMKHLCLISSAAGNQDQIMKLKSKELEDAFLALEATISGQVKITLKKDYSSVITECGTLQAVISTIIRRRQTQNNGGVLTQEDLKEIEDVMSKIKIVFSQFVKVVAEAKQGQDVQGKSASGSVDSSAESSKGKTMGKSTTMKDVQVYTSTKVLKYLGGLEKSCPKTKEFLALFKITKEYAKHLCLVSSTTGNQDQIMKSKSKELENAFLALEATVSGQVKTTMKNDYSSIMTEFGTLQAVISTIIRRRQTQNNGDVLTQEDLKEIEGVMSKLEIVFSQFVKVVAEAKQGQDVNVNGKTDNGSGAGSAESSKGQGMGKDTEVNDVRVCTSNEVSKSLGSLEASCPKTKEFLALFKILNEYTKHICIVSSVAGNQDQIIKSKSKELENAVLALEATASASGQVKITLTDSYSSILAELGSLQVVISTIIQRHQTQKNSGALTPEDLKEIEGVMSKLKIVFSQLVKTVEEANQEHSANPGGQNSNGDAQASADNATIEANQQQPDNVGAQGSNGSAEVSSETSKKQNVGKNATVADNQGNPVEVGQNNSGTDQASAGSSNDLKKGNSATTEDIRVYTSNELLKFVGSLEGNCPKTKEFLDMFNILKEYVKKLCVVSAATGNEEQTVQLKFKELDKALAAFELKASVKSQAGMTLKQDRMAVTGELGVLKAKIGTIKLKGFVNRQTPKDFEEFNGELVRLENVLSGFVKVAVEADVKHSVNISGGK